MNEEVIPTRRKKSGVPVLNAFEEPQFIHQFSKISKAIVDSKLVSDSFKVNETTLAGVNFQLQTFMESALGKNSSDKVTTKIPTSIFQDFAVNGSLMIVLIVALKHQIKAGWTIFDLALPQRFSDGLEIILAAETVLLTSQILRRPQVFFSKVPGPILGELKRIVKQHGGSIVGTVDGASHVIDWDEEVDSLPTELSEEFVRTLEVRPSEEGGRALVHWFYHPDSYDEWIPSDHVDVSEPPDTVSELNLNRQWHVCCRFVIDCNIFNEWGNEIDYENIPEGEGEDDDTNDDGTSTISPVKSGAVRKARGRRRSEAVKAKKMPILESIVVTEKMMQDSPPPLDNSTFESIAVIDILAGSECQLSFINPRKTEGRALIDSNIEILEKADDTLGVTNSIGTKRPAGASNDRSSSSTSSKHKKDRVLGRKGSSQPHLKLPSWYTSESVNAIEIKYLPDIFSREADRAKNVGEYLTMRNFIVSMYAHNPSIYISATDCRRKMSGDVCTVLKIHDFLDSFGVINFNVKPENRPLSPHALIPHWYQDSKSTLSSGMSVMSSVDSVGDELTVAWSDSMDRSLRRCAVANQGDWAVVASILAIEFSNYGAADNSNSWKPTSQDCMARFVSLPLKAPSFNCTKYKGSADIGLASIAAAKAAQQLQFLSSQIADSAASALGFDTVQNVVTDTLLSLSSEELSTDSILSATNPNSTAIKNFLGELESQLDSISDDAASCYLDNLEEKMKLILDVDRMINLERERLEVDRRDVQIQRANLAVHTPYGH